MTNITRPGEEVSVDFADVGNGQYLLIVVDDFSIYPEVEIISSLTAKVVIRSQIGGTIRQIGNSEDREI